MMSPLNLGMNPLNLTAIQVVESLLDSLESPLDALESLLDSLVSLLDSLCDVFDSVFSCKNAILMAFKRLAFVIMPADPPETVGSLSFNKESSHVRQNVGQLHEHPRSGERGYKALEGLHEETQRLESLYQRKLAAFDELKKSLLHRAFSGEL